MGLLTQLSQTLYSIIYEAELSSMVSLTLLSWAPWCHWHCWVELRGVIDIAELSSLVKLRLLSLALRCHWHCWVELRGVIDISELNFAVSLTVLMPHISSRRSSQLLRKRYTKLLIPLIMLTLVGVNPSWLVGGNRAVFTIIAAWIFD